MTEDVVRQNSTDVYNSFIQYTLLLIFVQTVTTLTVVMKHTSTCDTPHIMLTQNPLR
jgi:hypothetical protein